MLVAGLLVVLLELEAGLPVVGVVLLEVVAGFPVLELVVLLAVELDCVGLPVLLEAVVLLAVALLALAAAGLAAALGSTTDLASLSKLAGS